MKKITINLISADLRLDEFYHKVALFEPFKRLGNILAIDYELEKSEPDQAFLDRFKKQLEDAGQFVTAAWIAQHPKVHYVNWDVRVSSSGTKWFMLEDYLKQFGIQKPESRIQTKTKTI